MYHWYLLGRSLAPGDTSLRAIHPGKPTFSDLEDSSLPEGIPAHEQRRFFVLGLVELLPLFAATIVSTQVESSVTSIGLIAGGVFVSALICWILRHHVSPTRIGATLTSEALEGDAPETVPLQKAARSASKAQR